jgi:hypothetical protein
MENSHRGNGGGNGQIDDSVVPWSENISYEGFLKHPCATFRPDLFLSLTGNEYKLLSYLTFLRWRFAEHTGRLRLALEYLTRGTGLSESSIRRCLKSLETKQFLRRLKIDRNRGNEYLVYSILLLDSSGQKERMRNSSGQIDRTARSKRTDAIAPQAQPSGQKEQQNHIQTSSERGALRYRPKEGPAGGENVGASNTAGEKRSPDGQIETPGQGQKGVALPGDPFITTYERVMAKAKGGVQVQRQEGTFTSEELESHVRRVSEETKRRQAENQQPVMG